MQLEENVVAHAILPKPSKILIDIEKIGIKGSQKILILVKDNSLVREREQYLMSEKM